MSASGWIWIAAGIALLAVLAMDVFTTVLYHWGRSGPIGRRVIYGVWKSSLRISARLSRARRHQMLGLVGPILIPAIVGLWAALAVVGFAFLYVPFMPDGFDRWEPRPRPAGLGDALYFSGYTFFTLGYGDIVPTTIPLRALAIVQTGAGFALVTFVISYFFSVYGAYTHKKVLAESLFYQAGRSADAAQLIARHLTGGASVVPLVNEVSRLRDGIVRLRSEYSDYPILHFFRDRLPQQSFLRLLFVAQDLSLLLDTVVDPEERPEIAGIGARSGMYEAVQAAQVALVRALLQQVPNEVREAASSGPEQRQRWAEHYAHAQETLAAAGIPVRRDAGAVSEYFERRSEWEPLLRACTEALGEEWEDVSGEEERSRG